MQWLIHPQTSCHCWYWSYLFISQFWKFDLSIMLCAAAVFIFKMDRESSIISDRIKQQCQATVLLLIYSNLRYIPISFSSVRGVHDDLDDDCFFPLDHSVTKWCWLPCSQILSKYSLLSCDLETEPCCHSFSQEHSGLSYKTSTSPNLLHLKNICTVFQWHKKLGELLCCNLFFFVSSVLWRLSWVNVIWFYESYISNRQ